VRRLKGVDRAVFAHGRPADGDYRSKVSEKLAKEGHDLSSLCPRDRGMLDSSLYKLICENVCMASLGAKKRESHFLFCTPHPCPEWGVSLYFEKCLPAFCVVGGIDCVRDSKVGTP